MVFVLGLGVGERGLVGGVPEHGLQAAVRVAFLRQLQKRLDDLGFECRGHREVGALPVAADAEALELGLLDAHPLGGVGSTAGAERVGRPLLFLLAELLHHLNLDGQAVVVPAGDVGRAKALQRLVTRHDIFQRLVERMAEVEVAVGVGRAVVEDERLGFRAVDALLVDVFLLPELLEAGLARGQVGAHRELRLREVEGLAVVHEFVEILKFPGEAGRKGARGDATKKRPRGVCRGAPKTTRRDWRASLRREAPGNPLYTARFVKQVHDRWQVFYHGERK